MGPDIFSKRVKFLIAILNGQCSTLDRFFIFVKIEPLGGSIFDADGTIKFGELRGIAMMFINGQWVKAESGNTFSVFNPSNGEKIGEVADGSRSDAVRAIEAAHRAFALWSSLTSYQRSEYLYRAYHLMMDHS